MLKQLFEQKTINNRTHLEAYSMSELVVVLCIIGIFFLLVLPNNNSVIVQTKSIEARGMLTQIYGLQKSHFYRFSRYTEDMEALGFEQATTIEEGGQAVYKIEIIDASVNQFKARATSLSDFDGDGSFNTWEIDNKRILKETVRD